MAESKKYSAEEMLDAFTIADAYPRCFQVGCFSQRLTLHAQQIRAFNLLWSLIETKTVRPGASVGIIGGGLAGITAASAACAYGCKVTLYEQNSEVLHFQRGNRLRYLHPNIYDWPRHEAQDCKTRHLPFLSWNAGFSDDVATEILEQWKIVEPHIKVHRHCRVTELHPGLDYVDLAVDGLTESGQRHDVAILCVGYGYEKTLNDTQRLSYWQNDSLGQGVFFKAKKKFLVTGCGDGGLTDALRLALRDFNHARFVLDIAITFSQELREELGRIEDAAYELFETSTHSDSTTPGLATKFCRQFLNEEYEKLALTPGLIKYLQENRRKDTEVVLNNRGPAALTLEASPINRFAVYSLMRVGAIRYLAGEPEIVRNSDGTYLVQFGPKTGTAEVFDEVIVRQGVEPIINQLIAKSDYDRLKANALKDSKDLTRIIHFPGIRFLQKEFEDIRASFIGRDALWYQVDFPADLRNRSQPEYIAQAKSMVQQICNRIDATLVDNNDYDNVADKTLSFIYILEKDGLQATWTASIPRSESTQAGQVITIGFQLIVNLKTDSKVMLDLILNLELMPYQRFVMGVNAGIFSTLDSFSTLSFRELSVTGLFEGYGAGPVFELSCSSGMYHAHSYISVQECVKLLTNKASNIILDLYNRTMNKSNTKAIAMAEGNVHLTISPRASHVWEWSARDMLL